MEKLPIQSLDFLNQEKRDDNSCLNLRVTNDNLLLKVHGLMSGEFISQGGNLRDLDFEQLQQIAYDEGEVWAAVRQNEVVATFTVIPIVTTFNKWFYINNGVVHPSERHIGGQIIEKLHREHIASNNSNNSFVVISVVSGIFLRLGFSEVNLDKLRELDNEMAEIIGAKLRPNKESHIFIL